MPDTVTLLHSFLDETAARLPRKTALVFGGVRYQYAEVRRRAASLAATLEQRGVRRGDRVAIFLDNGIDAVVGIYAAMMAGAAFMPINPLTKGDKLAFLLNDSRAAALVTQSQLCKAWQEALPCNATVHTCVVAGTGDVALDPRCVPFDSALAVAPASRHEHLIDQDLAAILYTSGSTGHPKGVMLTHLNMVSAARSIIAYLDLVESDVILCSLPLAFDYGLYQVLMAFAVGATVVLERSFAFPARILEVMARERVTVFPGVPTMFTTLMDLSTLEGYDLGSLRLITNTAAALPEERIRRLRALFPQARLYSMYGLTECKRVSYLPPEQLDIRPTSVGRGMPNEEVWLVDESGSRLPNGSTGELVVRGSHVMRGYWERPEETEACLKPGPYPGEKVLYSGDIFRTDEEGYLYFVGRKDDVIKSRGEKVSPREVENALYGLDGVEEAAVVGVPDDHLGQAVKAFLVLRPGFAYTERDVIKHCLDKLESFMAPKHVSFVRTLPKTDTGKIRKTGLE